jgi:dihydropteroate synthase type 2
MAWAPCSNVRAEIDEQNPLAAFGSYSATRRNAVGGRGNAGRGAVAARPGRDGRIGLHVDRARAAGQAAFRQHGGIGRPMAPIAASRPLLFGIVNLTADSFSDGGRFLDPAAALAHARALVAGGADVVDLGAAASNIDAAAVPVEEEIRRLDPLLSALKSEGVAVSVDSFAPAVQRFAIARGADFLNDIQGFPEPALYPDLAAAGCRLIVMHAVQGRGRAQRLDLSADEVWDHIVAFFAERIAALERAGVARERLAIDPGMGFFLSSRPEVSFRVLNRLGELKKIFGLPVMVSVSRKSFLRAATGRGSPDALGPATLAAELYAAEHGADLIRTHDPAALADGLRVTAALRIAADS